MLRQMTIRITCAFLMAFIAALLPATATAFPLSGGTQAKQTEWVSEVEGPSWPGGKAQQEMPPVETRLYPLQHVGVFLGRAGGLGLLHRLGDLGFLLALLGLGPHTSFFLLAESVGFLLLLPAGLIGLKLHLLLVVGEVEQAPCRTPDLAWTNDFALPASTSDLHRLDHGCRGAFRHLDLQAA